MNLYQENILDHYKNPRHKGKMEGADVSRHESNPLCGDVVDVFLKFKDGKVSEASFEGEGCAISMAAASMVSETLVGKTEEQLLKMGRQEIIELLGIDPGASRIKCATLALKAFHAGVAEKRGKETDAEGL